MQTKFPNVPNTGPLAFRLSMKGRSIQKELNANVASFINSSITPGIIVGAIGLWLVPTLSGVPDGYWLPVNAAVFGGLFWFIRKLRLPKFIKGCTQRNHAYLQTTIERNFIEEIAVLLNDTAKSQYSFSEWRTDAESLLKDDPYLFCATVLTHKPALWDSVSCAVYDKLMDSVPEIHR